MAAINIGNLVWAKMRGHPWWPGRVENPPNYAKFKKGHDYVFFFGSEDYAWISLKGIVPYAENIDKFSKNKKSALFRKAVEDIANFAKFVVTSESENEVTDDEEETPKSDEVISKTMPEENAKLRRYKQKVSSRKNKSDLNEEEIICVQDVNNRKSPVPFVIKIESDHEIDDILEVPVGDDEEYDNYCKVQTLVLGDKPPTLQRIPENVSFLSNIVASRKTARGGQVNDMSCLKSAVDPDYFVPKAQTDHKENPCFEDAAKQSFSTKPLVSNILSAKSCHFSSDFEDIVSEKIRRPVVAFSKEDREICAQKLAALSSDRNFNDTDDHEVEDGELKPTKKVIGFIGLGMIGKGFVNNLLLTGHKVNIWNRTAEKCQEFTSKGAAAFDTPSNLVQSSDIVFICVADMQAANEVIFGRDGIGDGLSIKVNSRKGVVNMTSISPEKSKEIFNMLDEKTTDYLEAQVDGSSFRANLGKLTLMCSGSMSLYSACETCFYAMSGCRKPVFLTSNIEDAPKMKLIFGTLRGAFSVAVKEAVTSVKKYDLDMKHFIQILKLTAFNCQDLTNEGFAMMERSLLPNTQLCPVHNDSALGVKLLHTSKESMPVASADNKVYKNAEHLE